MTFQEMGEELRKARESRGMSLDEVVEITKISRRNIVALEEGNTDHLPHPVYAKGFVRSYARLLGLDAEELAMVVDQIIPEHEDNLPSGYGDTREADRALAAHESSGGSGKSRLPSILLFIVLLAALIGAVIYFGKLYTVLEQPTASVEEQAETASADESAAAPEQQVAPAPASEEQQVADAVDEAEQGADNAAEAPVADAGEAGQEAVDVAESAQEAETVAAEAVEKAPAASEADDVAKTVEATIPDDVESVGEESGEPQDQFRYAHNIVIRAVTEAGTWVGVWKGDEEDLYRDFILQNGEPLRLKFNSKRRIRIGNAGGVEVTHNGEPMELNAKKGSVKTLVFDVP